MKTMFRSALAALCLSTSFTSLQAAQYNQRLGNLSTRAQVGTGANIMITGFVVQEGAPKKVLIRAVGPRLNTAFGVAGVLNDPQLQIFDANGRLVLTNDNWLTDDAATMTAVGAFGLTSGSRDAALVATLSPGAYTAQVSGVGNTQGVAMLEIYDVTGSARLMNLSTRALVGSGANALSAGLVVAPGGGARRVMIRAVGPALADFGVTGTNSDPALSIIDLKTQRTIASNDNWGSTEAAALTTAFSQSGAFPLAPGSKDAALIMDVLPEGNYSIQVTGVGSATGIALVEVYDLSPEKLSTISVAATSAITDTVNLNNGVFTFTRVGPTDTAVTVGYTLSGSAASGTDYAPLSGSVTIPVGASTATVSLTPRANAANTNNRIATLTIAPNNAYGIGVNDSASVTIQASSGPLYITNLRAVPGAVSTAYGTATVLLSGDEQYALINVAFANLSSPEVVAHLAIDGNYVYNLPQGQVANAFWDFAPTARYSSADILAALKAGRVTVSIDSATYPAGELAGGFVRSSGSAAFNPPAAPTPVDLSKVTAQDAARFLTQATFGPTQADLAGLMAKGYNAWLTEQFAAPASKHFETAMADMAAFGGGVSATINGVNTPNVRISGTNRQAAWWKIAVTAPDQLRQRMAFALSEILVVSDLNGTIGNWQDGAATYYDIFSQNAFGNFRDVLEKVTLSPMMGIYLSSLRNAKATYDTRGNPTSVPDENYAREIMQLFTVGLNELNPDGTLRLDSNGQPIPTYTQDTIVQTAKVFTGWAYANTTANATSNTNLFRGSGADYINPMMLWPAFHDDTQKNILGGKVIPAGQGGLKDLKDTLDALFNHPNTGPFISRQLIQRLVTSNPSPAYIYRVAQVFANNGAGVRGDLGAVARAILLDPEARSAAIAATPTFGKLKEPLLRGTALFRAFDGRSNAGRFNISNPEGNLAQASLRAPTVFNFFEPDYVLPGATAAAGLVAPEYQIMNDTTAITQVNFYYTYISTTRSTTNMAEQNISLTYDSLIPMARTPAQLVDWVSTLLTGNSLNAAGAAKITSAITSMPNGTPDTEKCRMAIYLVLTSPAGAIQK